MEAVSAVISAELEFTRGGDETIFEAGTLVAIPPDCCEFFLREAAKVAAYETLLDEAAAPLELATDEGEVAPEGESASGESIFSRNKCASEAEDCVSPSDKGAGGAGPTEDSVRGVGMAVEGADGG
jgi:hypothetical protein